MKALTAYPSSGKRYTLSLAVAVLQAACVVFVLWTPPVVAEEASLEERFLKEAPEKWLEYRRIVARHTEGRAKGTNLIDYGDKKRWTGEWDRSFALNVGEKQASARIVNFDKDAPQSAEGFNPHYAFQLAAGRGGKWTIERLRTGVTAVPDDLMGRHARYPLVMGDHTTPLGSAMHLACAGQQIGLAWLPRMAASPDFHVTRVTASGSGGLVKVEFTFEPKDATGHGANVRSGTLVLDSRRHWLIREADAQASFNFASEDEELNGVRGTVTVKNVLADANMPVPYVSRQVYTATCEKALGGKPWKDVDTTTIELRDVPQIDEKQFRLSSYGLPEPPKK